MTECQKPDITPSDIDRADAIEMQQIVFENVSCDFCQSTDFEKELDGIDWEFGREERFSIVRCRQCGLIQLNPRPIASSMHLIYPRNYGFYQRPSKEPRPSKVNWSRKIKQYAVSRLLKKSTSYQKPRSYPYLDKIKRGEILDVGCATGCSAYPYGKSGSIMELKRRGWSVHGCDIDATAAKIGSEMGLDIRVGRLTDIDFGDNSFGVVRFNHVLEHSTSPMKDLEIAARLLKNDGFLIISGPNIFSAAYFLFKQYWSGLDLPRHFYHFTPEILNKYCEKLRLRVTFECFDSIAEDFMHSFKHFLHSDAVWGSNKVCTKENVINSIYKNGSFGDLLRSLKPIIEFFNERQLGDNYTIIARKERPYL